MTESTRRILDQVRQLPAAERAELITALLATCDAEDDAIDASWLEECRRRRAAFKASGEAVPWEQVQRELEDRRRRRAT